MGGARSVTPFVKLSARDGTFQTVPVGASRTEFSDLSPEQTTSPGSPPLPSESNLLLLRFISHLRALKKKRLAKAQEPTRQRRTRRLGEDGIGRRTSAAQAGLSAVEEHLGLEARVLSPLAGFALQIRDARFENPAR
eukprot:2469682-Rhodomonas_salina.2